MIPNNLPLQLTSFIGREREIAEVRRLLGTTHLLTLTGSGGCGKTRLAIQVAADVCASFQNGIWFVDLAPLNDPTLVPQTIATVFRLQEQGSRPIAEILRDYLREKQLLLLLDNCEHLIDACAHFADNVLHLAPQVTLLTTSREALNIPGEITFRAPSLSVPDVKNLPPLESIAQSEAVRLFVARASAVRSTFTLTEQNVRTVAQICYRLDGMPLAIELAAARMKALGVDEIAARLDDRFNLLTLASRTAPSHQQTLRASIDWSHDSLLEQERVLFRYLSVFAGGWTLQAAELVCAGDGISSSDVLDLLTRLVDKSLVSVEEYDTQARYRMLETVRQYAREKLIEFGELYAVRDRHLNYFVEWAEVAEQHLHGPKQLSWLNRLETDNDNLRAALDWSIEKGDRNVEAGLRLAGALEWFWWLHGHWSEGSAWFDRVLAINSTPSPHSKQVRAKALVEASWLARWQGDFELAIAMSDESLALFRELADLRGMGVALYRMAAVELDREDFNRTLILAKESTGLLRQVGDQFHLGWALSILGFAAERKREYDQASEFFQESLALSQAAGDKATIALASNFLGGAMENKGDYEQARKLFEDALIHFNELNSKFGVGITLTKLGEVALHQGQYEKAVALCKESLSYSRELGDKGGQSWALDILGIAACRMHKFPRAVELFKEALLLNAEGNYQVPIAENLAGLGAVEAEQGQLESAARLCGAAEVLLESVDADLGPADREEYRRTVEKLRAQLDETHFDNLWAEGRKMTMQQALDYVSAVSFTPVEMVQAARPIPPRHKARETFGGLTPRECEVATLVALGKSNHDIASELVLSDRTVENHVGNILSKLEMHSRSQLAAWVVEKGLHKSKP